MPNDSDKNRIGDYYPKIETDTEAKLSFSGLFDFEKIKIEGEFSPLAQIAYVRQKSRFIIVDGQHRAMAILALHRQLNKTWGSDRYASYYAHIGVDPAAINRIELPVCIAFFPEFHEGNGSMIKKGLTLTGICRQIFLVVNKTAKKVSQERELLLDDDDFAAKMMRRTLSALKGRGEEADSVARVYSFAYGDSTERAGGTVVSGEIEYSSAIALHKIHAANTFGVPEAFLLQGASDVSDGRRIYNPSRPGQLLIGTELSHWSTLSRTSAKSHSPSDVDKAVQLLGDLAQFPLLLLFDKFRPFRASNQELRRLRTRLQDPTHRADPIQNKAYTLLFEGSGVLSVFEDHKRRLNERNEELKKTGASDDYISNQLKDAAAVSSALELHLKELRISRACSFFGIDCERFLPDASEDDVQTLNAKARSIFATVATQAFQIGYSMAISSLVEHFTQDTPNVSYASRTELIRGCSEFVVGSLNVYFSPDSDTKHRTLTGLIVQPRIGVFSANSPGLRQLLRLSGTTELNERQWEFFKYCIFEVLFAPSVRKEWDNLLGNSEARRAFHSYGMGVWEAAKGMRDNYFKGAVDRALTSSEFVHKLELERATRQGEGRDPNEIEEALEDLREAKRRETEDLCRSCVEASVGKEASEKDLNEEIHHLCASVGAT